MCTCLCITDYTHLSCTVALVSQDAFLHSLVTGLIGMKEEFEAEDFCTAVFDEFFFTCINIDNVVRHLLRLLWWVHPRLPPARLDTLLKVRLLSCCLLDW